METPDEQRRPSAPETPAEVVHQSGGSGGNDPLASLRLPGFRLYLLGSLFSGSL